MTDKFSPSGDAAPIPALSNRSLKAIKARHVARQKPVMGRCANGHQHSLNYGFTTMASSLATEISNCSECGLPVTFTFTTSTIVWGETADDDIAALLAEIARLRALVPSPQPETPTEKAPKEFFNTKWGGKGFGGAGDYRVIVRTERKGSQRTYVQIIDDSDGVGFGFTSRQTPAIIEALQAALASLALPVVQDEAPKAAELVKMPCPHCGLFSGHLSRCEYEKFAAIQRASAGPSPAPKETT